MKTNFISLAVLRPVSIKFEESFLLLMSSGIEETPSLYESTQQVTFKGSKVHAYGKTRTMN